MSLVKHLVYKKLCVGVLVTSVLLIAPGCGWGWFCSWFGGNMEKNMKIEEITAEDLKKRMEESSSLMVLNVLSKDSFDDCHINNSLSVPLDTLEGAAKNWKKDQEIVVYCASYTCHASKEAYKKLRTLGFTNVKAYEGGTKEWKAKGFDVNGPCNADYLKK